MSPSLPFHSHLLSLPTKLHLYMENYGDAVIALTMAARLDPSWALVQQKLESTRQFLRNMNEAIVTKVCR